MGPVFRQVPGLSEYKIPSDKVSNGIVILEIGGLSNPIVNFTTVEYVVPVSSHVGTETVIFGCYEKKLPSICCILPGTVGDLACGVSHEHTPVSNVSTA